MLDQSDIQVIRTIVSEIVQPMQNDILRLDGKIDALARVTDRRFDEMLAAFNAYATVTDRRLLKLETRVGIV